jgi:hypothetical protein
VQSTREVLTVAVLAAMQIGCGTSSSLPPDAIVRDSAGIRIIELSSSTRGHHEIRVVGDSSFSVPDRIEFGGIVETLPLPLAGGFAVDWTALPAGGHIHRLLNAAGDLLIQTCTAGTDTLHRFPPPHKWRQTQYLLQRHCGPYFPMALSLDHRSTA